MREKATHTDPRLNEGIHLPFIAASLLFAVVGGFTLAVSLPIEGLLGGVDVSWVAHAQVHGHIQVVGFAGLFVIGMALRLTPRFGGRRSMALPGVERWVWILLVGGLLGRSLGQPLANHTPFAALTMAGTVAEVCGAILFATMTWLTLTDAVRARQPHAILLMAAAGGLVIQSVLGLWWITRIVADGGVLVPAGETRVLVHLQLFGFLLPALLGVGIRSFPTFFARKPPGVFVGGLIAVLAIGGSTVWTAGGVLAANGDGSQWVLLAVGQGLTGASILVAIGTFGPWRRATRLAAASKGLAW